MLCVGFDVITEMILQLLLQSTSQQVLVPCVQVD